MKKGNLTVHGREKLSRDEATKLYFKRRPARITFNV